jgi:hypothetical protein
MAIERGAPLFMHPQHRTRPQPGSLVITERLHALFQSILAEQGRFAVNALTSQVTRLLTPFREPRPWLPYLHGVQ